MSISSYIKEIGRGKRGARDLSREQAADLMAQLLDGQISALEIGAFCIAMRVKGESPEELAGFLDAVQPRLALVSTGGAPTVVIPAYNGARKLPALVPLLALLLAREGVAVLVHGSLSEVNADARVTSESVLRELGIDPLAQPGPVAAGQVAYAPTAVLSPALDALLQVRRTLALRNSAHSLVKLMNPVQGPALILTSYTHREYIEPMGHTLRLVGHAGLILRGTEGEPVADPRRTPRMDAVIGQDLLCVDEGETGSLAKLDELPTDVSAASTARYTRAVLAGELPLPEPIARQLRHVLALLPRLAQS
ncbi:DNA-binding protein YbiB [Comamonas serinivorans]|uniref:DNA-binding protein YbiB n=1 Tax=Comamonas serinivorans TaxID=1082851 RepID=A0A1Y0ENB8_9BURK|nr:DNA-binding protein YbiB [Comamonas serinivorans]ARU05144.1 DNA-binding protein YbiB [Comamonas serinivorans]